VTTAVILAAGESRRLGTPKQLLKLGGTSLIVRIVEAALESRCRGVTITVGAHADRVRSEVEPYDVRVVDNPDWREGKASSIRVATDIVARDLPPVSGILFLACDQPHVTAALLNELLQRFEASGGRPSACAYGTTVGIPAIVPRRLFGELMRLRGDRGAQTILCSPDETIERVPFPEGLIDIDGAADAAAVGAVAVDPPD